MIRGQNNENRRAPVMMENLEGRTLHAMTPSIPIPPPDPTRILIGLNQPVQPATTTTGIIAILIG